MKTLLRQLLWFVTALLKQAGAGGGKRAAAEIMLLKQQLQVLSRNRRRAPNLTVADRFAFAFNSLWIQPRRLAHAAIVVSPATLLRFHKALVERKYRILFGLTRHRKPGPKGPTSEMIALIVSIKKKNPRFGYGKIALMVTRAMGVDTNETTVKRILGKYFKPKPGKGPSWLTFLGHSKDSLWSLDLFRSESILLKSYCIMVVMDQYSRQIIGYSICNGNPNGQTVSVMFAKIIGSLASPVRLSTDHDPLFESKQWKSNLRVLGIDEIKSVPHVPWSHPFIERIIGTVRRDYLDQIFFWGELDLERKLKEYVEYYNQYRVHYAFKEGIVPAEKYSGTRATKPVGPSNLRWRSHCRGLFITPLAA